MSDNHGYWKTLAAYAYIIICIFDFLLMPAYTSYSNRLFSETVILTMGEENKNFSLAVIEKLRLKNWEPVTTSGGFIFHFSFGSILTGAALVGSINRPTPNK